MDHFFPYTVTVEATKNHSSTQQLYSLPQALLGHPSNGHLLVIIPLKR